MSADELQTKGLVRVLSQEETVLFIGSGISLWSGLPSWSKLVEELITFIEVQGFDADLVRKELSKGDLLQAASYGFDKLTKNNIAKFIREICLFGSAEPHDIHKKIVTLGPRCFITTNYDNLIEQSLKLWLPDVFFPPPITNRHVTEIAEIVGARSKDYIFKPHGDAADSESIILTREQYRQLLPGGNAHAALDGLKSILTTRPVVYLGFGLRDPDFSYIRDLLINTYKNGTRDHYAIMADVSEAEKDYWKRNYGIHLIGYDTTVNSDGFSDHSLLLSLLDNLAERKKFTGETQGIEIDSPEFALLVARYANGLSGYSKAEPETQIRVRHKKNKDDSAKQNSLRRNKFYSSLVGDFILNAPSRTLLVGLPGAGKTYSLKRAVAKIAVELQEKCLSQQLSDDLTTFPLFVDLKLYDGNIESLVEASLPRNLTLEIVTKYFKTKLFLDSFNEMSSDFRESVKYESDFSKLFNKYPRIDIVVGSRTSDGLHSFGLEEYVLDQIRHKEVVSKLLSKGIEFKGKFQDEIYRLLSSPMYFQKIYTGVINLPIDAHPKDFYEQYFVNVDLSFATAYGITFEFQETLSQVAYFALENGSETFSVERLQSSIHANLGDDASVEAQDIVNWLISSFVVNSYSGGKIAFVHQSITEFLAATRLVKEFEFNNRIITEKLRHTSWDQALFFGLSMMSEEQSKIFFNSIAECDLDLAINASKYLESGSEIFTTQFLDIILSKSDIEFRNSYEISQNIIKLQTSSIHEPQLLQLIGKAGSIGGAALVKLGEIRDGVNIMEFLPLLLKHRSDYNFCVIGLGPTLSPYCTVAEIQIIVDWIEDLDEEYPQTDEPDNLSGLIRGAAVLFERLDLAVVYSLLCDSPSSKTAKLVGEEIMSGILQFTYTNEAVEIASDLLLKNAKSAAVVIHFFSHRPEDVELSFAIFNDKHLSILEAQLFNNKEQYWALNALKDICSNNKECAEHLKVTASKRSGLAKAALVHCYSPDDSKLFLESLAELLTLTDEEINESPLHIFQAIKFDWTGLQELFIDLLKLRNVYILDNLLPNGVPSSVNNIDTIEFGKSKFGPMYWWLDWIKELIDSDAFWNAHKLGSFLGGHLDIKGVSEIVRIFESDRSNYRQVILIAVLPYIRNITTDDLSNEAISYILADLTAKNPSFYFKDHVIIDIATEQFATDRLVPLLRNAKEPSRTYLKSALKGIGRRFGKRYLIENNTIQN